MVPMASKPFAGRVLILPHCQQIGLKLRLAFSRCRDILPPARSTSGRCSMATRTSITVDVDDAGFRRFRAICAKHADALKETPDLWKDAALVGALMEQPATIIRRPGGDA